MRLRRVALAVALACSAGCTSLRLRERTNHQASTLPDLQYQQVLGNLAMFAVNPSALPWHVNLREGTTQITDSGSGGVVVDLGPPATTQPNGTLSRTVVVQWGMAPVIEPTELRLLRIAYRRAHGSGEMPDAEFLDDLAQELKNQFPSNPDVQQESEVFYEKGADRSRTYADFEARVLTTNDDGLGDIRELPPGMRSPLAKNVVRKIDALLRKLDRIGPGWFQTGRKADVPRDACYVGRYRDCYVWVGPEGREALTQFTLTVMEISSLIKETQSLISPGQVKFSPGDRGG